MEVDILPSVDFRRAGGTLKKLLIRYGQAGIGILAVRQFGQRMVVGYHYCSQVYADLCGRQNTTLKYGEQ